MSLSGPWQVLGIAPTSDRRAVKRAYARLLKQIDQENEAAEFERLRNAYERALQLAELQASSADPDPNLSSAPPVQRITSQEEFFHLLDGDLDERTRDAGSAEPSGSSSSHESSAEDSEFDFTVGNQPPPDEPTSDAGGLRDEDRQPDSQAPGDPLLGDTPSTGVQEKEQEEEKEEEEEAPYVSLAGEQAAEPPPEAERHRPTDEAAPLHEQAIDAVLQTLDAESDPSGREAAKRLFDFLQVEAGLSLIERERLELDLGHLLLSLSEMPRELFLTASTHFGWDEGDVCQRLFGLAGVQLKRRAVAWKQRDQWKRQATSRGDIGAAILLGEYQPNRYRWLALRPRVARSMKAALDRLAVFPEFEQYEVDARIVDWWRERLRRSPPIRPSLILSGVLLWIITAVLVDEAFDWALPETARWAVLLVSAAFAGLVVLGAHRLGSTHGERIRRVLLRLTANTWYRCGFALAAAALLPLHVLADLNTGVVGALIVLLVAWSATLHLREFALFVVRTVVATIGGAVTAIPLEVSGEVAHPLSILLFSLIYLAEWKDTRWLRPAFAFTGVLGAAVALWFLASGGTWSQTVGLLLCYGLACLASSIYPKAPGAAMMVAGALVVMFDLFEVFDRVAGKHDETVAWTAMAYAALMLRGIGTLVWPRLRAQSSSEH